MRVAMKTFGLCLAAAILAVVVVLGKSVAQEEEVFGARAHPRQLLHRAADARVLLVEARDRAPDRRPRARRARTTR